jgi:hypothetical protein
MLVISSIKSAMGLCICQLDKLCIDESIKPDCKKNSHWPNAKSFVW